MLFFTDQFLFFLSCFVASWICLPGHRKALVFGGSLIFYAWNTPNYIFILLASIITDFFVAKKIEVSKHDPTKRCWLALSLIVNLGLLFFFKYWNFLIDNLITFSFFSPSDPISWMRDPVVPIGISFYTFQTLSYTLDVYWGKTKANHDFIDYGAYVSLFPQLIAGPIIRYEEFRKQADRKKNWSLNFHPALLLRFSCGWLKKVVLADSLAIHVDQIFAQGFQSSAELWAGCLLFTAQVYLDFSAYSDMALALAGFLGFKFPENFNWPFRSKTFREFWHRWHMSLSFWVRDYLYFPLALHFRYHPKIFIVLSLTLTMVLLGLWHGAAWNFVVFGLWHGFFLGCEVLFKIDQKWPLVLRRLLVLAVSVVGFGLFRAESLSQCWQILGGLFSISGNWPELDAMSLAALLTVALSHVFFKKQWTWEGMFQKPAWVLYFLTILSWVIIDRGATLQENPAFIYFQF